MKISIVGWYGQGNVGDEAFRSVLPDFFEGHSVEFVTPPRTCNSPDIVVLGGGAVANPFYLETLPDCPRYAVGIDMAFSGEAELLAEKGFRAVFIRNTTDIETIRQKLGCPVYSMPDLAFFLKPSGEDVLGRYRRTGKPALGVFVTDYVNPAIDRSWEKFSARSQSFKNVVCAELDRMSKEYEVVLVPCSTGGYGDDRRINLDLKAYMEEQPTLIMDALSPVEVIDLIAGVDVTFCMRFHSHIFSVIAGKPILSIEFTRKVSLFLSEHGMESVGKFSGDSFELSSLSEKIPLAKEESSRFVPLSAKYRSDLLEIKKLVRQELSL